LTLEAEFELPSCLPVAAEVKCIVC